MKLKLAYDGEISGMSEEQIKEAKSFINSVLFGTIATNNPETGARLSAVNNLKGQTLGRLHYGTVISTQKAKNIGLDPRMEIMYTNADYSQMMLSGRAEILTDTEIKRELWQEWMDEYDPKGPEGDLICIIRFTPETIRAMIS